MPQLLLPFISPGVTQINPLVSVWRRDDIWTYFLGEFPIYSHRVDDQRMFRLTIAQLINSGACRQIEVINAFGVSKRSVIRAHNKLKEGGSEAFFIDRRGRKCAPVLTPEVLGQARGYLAKGFSIRQAAEELDVKYDTLRKAAHDGRLKGKEPAESATNKSKRTVVDAAAADAMGTACTRVEERTFAAFGVCEGAPVRFESCLDVPKGGVLCALPALLANGLLEGAEKLLGAVKGYYRTFHVLLLLAFMALCRIKTVEKVRGHAPGEFGKLLGLDRVPEVRCLRNKIDDLSAGDTAEKWACHLSKHWMDMDTDSAGTLYIDGHVRVYHGGLTKPPRRYVSRERLCLRGTTDYWVNDAIGRPFFVVEKTVDHGLLQTLQREIVPRLLRDIPEQANDQELIDNPQRCRFILVFDREGYSPAFFKRMWRKRISCMTYHKHPGADWPREWFTKQDVTMPNGESVTMALAEMGTLVGSGEEAMWMREVRKLTETGHQTSLVSTVYEFSHTQLGARMFSRWCQENFFRYMMEHFAIDLLQEYGTENLPGTEPVVNPAWRELNRTRNSIQSKLRHQQARFAEMTLHPEEPEDSVEKYEKWAKKKAELLEKIEQYESGLVGLKMRLKEEPKHITWDELEEKDRFYGLLPGRKRLMDTVKMISYRAETAMAGLLKKPAVPMAAARRLLQDLFVTEADILPQPEENRLLVRIHNASRPAANAALEQLFDELNAAEVCYPGTDMRMYYELMSKVN